MRRRPRATHGDAGERAVAFVTGLMQRAAGVVMLACGAVLLASAASAAVRWLRHADVASLRGGLATWLCIAALGVFTASVGLRLTLDRPTRDGSLLSPVGWGALGGVFVALTVVLVVLPAPGSGPSPAAALTLVIAAGCFRIGWRLVQRAKRR